MGKFVVMFLTEVFIILPILGTRFHGQDSYKQYYESRVNGGRLKHPTTASNYETIKKSYYELNKAKDKYASKDSFGSPDVWQARNGGDNYTVVTRCDYVGQTFCEDDPNYPQDLVTLLLATNSSLLPYANEDILAVMPRSDNQETPLCLSTERLIRPKTALNQQNEWLHILQANETNFHQSLRIEACIDENAKCRLIDGFAEGYVTTCEQKYIYREMLAISKNGEANLDHFRLPASCNCHVQFQVDSK